MTHAEYLPSIIDFIRQIGLQVIEKTLPSDTLLPGLDLGANCIFLDPAQLKYPGDLLHEAGHLAVTPRVQRDAVGTDALSLPWPTAGEEVGAILWSYAAALHLGIPVEVVLHSDGYKNDGNWLIESFAAGNYIGLPFLQWAGLCLDAKQAALQDRAAFPVMLKWLRD
jgi:hypothetical protein